jgi:hypothetical protein
VTEVKAGMLLAGSPPSYDTWKSGRRVSPQRGPNRELCGVDE